MTLHSIILFCHVAAVLSLFANLIFEVLSLISLRRASDLTEVHERTAPVPAIPSLAIASVLVVLSSGIYLAVRMSAFEMAWPNVTVVALLLMAPLGVFTDNRLRTIRRSSAQMSQMKLVRGLRDPILKTSLGIRLATFFGIVLLITAKPTLWQSIVIVVCSAFLGLLLSLLAWRRTGPLCVLVASLKARGEI